MMRLFSVALTLVALSAAADEIRIERIFRPARVTRGETCQKFLALIDEADWLTHPDLKWELESPEMRVLRFRRAFTVKEGEMPLEIDVSGDERFYLTCDGQFVARGPHRGTVDNWMFQSYRLTLAPGEHVLEAVVWKHSKGMAPFAQLSWRLGFALAAARPYGDRLTTRDGRWEVGLVHGVGENGKDPSAWGVGAQDVLTGSGLYDLRPAAYVPAVSVRSWLCNQGWGCREGGWQPYPSQLKDQTERRMLPGKFVSGGIRAGQVFATRTVMTNLWDLGVYCCAYPELKTSGGKGATVRWSWAESLTDADGLKRNRAAWRGKRFSGITDTFVSDGRADAVFSTSWFRCGRWCQIVIETGDEPLAVRDIALVESRYPLEAEAGFVAKGAGADGLDAVQDICVRGMQMCSHEMLFDCPYYEQQMYAGDTRLQLNVISSMTSDDALVRRAIEFFDLGRHADGLVPFNFPSWGHQEGVAYTLCYLMMLPDYVRLHADREWTKARLPGYRNTLAAVEYYAREDGLIAGLPGWAFVDWAKGWAQGVPPGAWGKEPSAVLNGLWLLSVCGAAQVESALGHEHLAAHWNATAERIAASMRALFWDEKRGLVADDKSHRTYSEHAQALALLGGALDDATARRCFESLVAAKDLTRCTVYFRYYLFETYFKFGRTDLFLRDLDLWRGYVAAGCTTAIEEPETEKKSARSDCHAWSSHPVYFLRAQVAGIRPDAPWFGRVLVAPCPGPLTEFKAQYPHPSGTLISVDFKGTSEHGACEIETPVAGRFVFAGHEQTLSAGVNSVKW